MNILAVKVCILCVFFEVYIWVLKISRLACTALKLLRVKNTYICNDCDVSGYTHCHFVNGAAKSNKNFKYDIDFCLLIFNPSVKIEAYLIIVPS